MNKFDLNVENYNISELEEVFSLKTNEYKEEDITKKKNELFEKINNDNTIGYESKFNMQNFLENAVKVLIINVKQESPELTFDNVKNNMMRYSDNLIIDNPYSALPKIDDNSKGNLTNESRGALNPISMKMISKGLTIDSRYRDSYFYTKSSDFIITFPYKFEKVTAYRIVSLTMPISFYNISQQYGNNIIQIQWGETDGLYTNTYNLVLADGIYGNEKTSGFSIVTAINDRLKLDPLSPNNYAGKNFKLKYVIDQISGRSIFTQENSATDPLYYKIVFNVDYFPANPTATQGFINFNKNLLLFLGWSLGFRVAEIKSNNVGPSNFGTISSSGLCIISYPTYGFVAIDDFNNSTVNYYITAFSASIAIPNVISKINLVNLSSSGPFTMSQSESAITNLNKGKQFFGPVTIQKLRFTLYDEFGRILNLNDMDIAIELQLDCMY